MTVTYFADTDTLYVEFRRRDVAETRDLDAQTVLDVDVDGNVCALTIEHAGRRVDLNRVRVVGLRVELTADALLSAS